MRTSTIKETVVNGSGLNSNGLDQVHDKYADVVQDFHTFIKDVEGLVKATAHLSGEELINAKAKLNDRIIQAKNSAATFGASVAERAGKTADSANQYVHEKPWQAIGVSAAAGLLVGYLLSGRK